MLPGNPNRYPNNADFAVAPREAKPIRNRQTVRLYFIGVHVLRDGQPPLFNIAGRIYQMPPIGEWIDVDELVAKEIVSRTAWYTRDNPSPIPGVTTSPDIAAAVKAAYDSGSTDQLDVRQMVSQHTIQNVDSAALVAELQRRGMNVDDLLESAAAAASAGAAAGGEGGKGGNGRKNKTKDKSAASKKE
ncbi:hypothetical protein Rctr85_012 [Virus Rctr85]|nr:hypothetical protein Rctr85_012 [Virus Rctr85]